MCWWFAYHVYLLNLCVSCYVLLMCMLCQDYPDYYEVIKKPMDMQRIQQKLLIGQYGCLDDMVTDFVMMFDNACKYNEPESVLYKVNYTACRTYLLLIKT